VKVVTLDMGLLVAGTKYRGEFEERLKKLMDEIKQNDDIILVGASGWGVIRAGECACVRTRVLQMAEDVVNGCGAGHAPGRHSGQGMHFVDVGAGCCGGGVAGSQLTPLALCAAGAVASDQLRSGRLQYAHWACAMPITSGVRRMPALPIMVDQHLALPRMVPPASEETSALS
jgi:hypothetical protein